VIDVSKISNIAPYNKFLEEYNKALSLNQPNIEAICISSFDKSKNEPDSRYVNLKYIINNEWIFFSNYNSPKAIQFDSINKISASFFWHKTNCQIRIKGTIKKTALKFSDDYFKPRDKSKNLLAITSNQSSPIDSYESFITMYKNFENEKLDHSIRPKYWGGFSFTPYYFEFWNGEPSRLNKRQAFYFEENNWKSLFLQP